MFLFAGPEPNFLQLDVLQWRPEEILVLDRRGNGLVVLHSFALLELLHVFNAEGMKYTVLAQEAQFPGLLGGDFRVP